MRRNETEMNGTLEQGNECETERSQLDRSIREKERSLPLLYVYILVPYSLYVQRGFREASNGGATTTSYNHDGEHDYYDTAWGLHEDPLVGFWLATPQSPAGNDISRDSVEGAPARAVPLAE
ncbi:hypothetical protein QLX08_000143 [Tetragonisca angustula]|uniref:Uncharacterized protein n=1 Tax=Tetragonisca angustula TaxID=166442 RepID=A0AAW1AKX7_9HYME